MRDRLLRDGFVILAVVFVGLRLFAIKPWADSVDAYAYWTTRDGVFYDAATTGRIGSYLYSPAFAQLLAPLTWLPIAVFTALWTALNSATLWFLLRRWALPSLLFLPIAFEVISGNVHLLYAAAIVVGFRWPAAWALMFLTKVTPGHRRAVVPRPPRVALARDRARSDGGDRGRVLRARRHPVGALDRHPPGRRDRRR